MKLIFKKKFFSLFPLSVYLHSSIVCENWTLIWIYRSPLFSFTLTHKNMQILSHANQAYDILGVLLCIRFYAVVFIVRCWVLVLSTNLQNMPSFSIMTKTWPKQLRLPVQVINWIIMNSRACETMLSWLFHPICNYILLNVCKCELHKRKMLWTKCMG